MRSTPKTSSHRQRVKSKKKSPEQFVAVLHANLFGTPISVSDQVEVERLLRSTGDKRLTWELIVSSYMNDPQCATPRQSHSSTGSRWILSWKRIIAFILGLHPKSNWNGGETT